MEATRVGDGRRTKIVATLGPRTRDVESLRALLEAGADVVRVNLAHGDLNVHEKAVALARQEAAASGRTVGVLVDLPGAKMRTGAVAGDRAALVNGSDFRLTSDDIEGDSERVSTSVKGLAQMVTAGDDVFLADGQIVLQVVSVSAAEVRTRVVRGGILRSRKGIHIPAAERYVEPFTSQDRLALEHALRLKADFVGLSFVRGPEDVRRARQALPKQGRCPRLLAKIETRSALETLPGIVAEADAVMVARGDLGIQTPLERVPIVQKQIIRACNRSGVPVVTATQMLESMTRDPLPTRAEVTDVATAIFDGTDAVMLSEETAIGQYPAAAVATMAQIARESEASFRDHPRATEKETSGDAVSWAVAHAAILAAEDLRVAALLCPTLSGATACRMAAYRPSMPILAPSSRAETLGALALVWGVIPLPTDDIPETRDIREEVGQAVTAARAAGLVVSGDLVVVVAGTPGESAGRTDFMRVVRV